MMVSGIVFLFEGVLMRTSSFQIFPGENRRTKSQVRVAVAFLLGLSWSSWEDENMVGLEKYWCPGASIGLEVEVLKFVIEVNSVWFLREKKDYYVELDYWVGCS